MDWLGLSGKVVVVTGAAGGIGGACMAAFRAAGARCVALDRSVTESDGDTILCDVTDPAAVAAAAAEVAQRHGGVDVLVNNAGILRPGGLATLSPADWQQVLDVNLTACLLTAQAFGARMRARGGGAMVHVSSIAATQPQPFSGAYSPGKAALAMLSRQLAAEWGPAGIRSNLVSPGLVETPLSAPFYAAPGVRAARESMVPLGRIGAPADMADAVVFLASPRAAYVTGQEIVVDGGLSQTLMGLVPRPGFSA